MDGRIACYLALMYFARPHWARYSDFNSPATIVEFPKSDFS